MKSMSTHHRLLIFLIFVLALTAILSPWFAIAADWVSGQLLGVERFPFSRIFDRTFMFLGILLFFLCRRLLRIGNLADLGLVSLARGRWRSAPWLEFSCGISCGVSVSNVGRSGL